jgi:hypothetical protein
LEKHHDFSRKFVAVDVGDMQLMDNAFFYARDDASVDVHFALGGENLHYKIVHVSEEPFNKTWLRARHDPVLGIGYIEIANYKRQKTTSGTNFEPLKIAEGTYSHYSYYMQMTLAKVAHNGEEFQGTPNEVNLWAYSIALYYKV